MTSTELRRRSIDAMHFFGLVLVALFLLVFVLFPRAQDVDSYLNPVKTDWVVIESRVDGNDLVISGTMIKRRDCTYIPPPRARDAFGNSYLVESQAASRSISWGAQDTPQKWGPWKVINGKGRKIEYYMVDRCHVLWDNLTILGEFNG